LYVRNTPFTFNNWSWDTIRFVLHIDRIQHALDRSSSRAMQFACITAPASSPIFLLFPPPMWKRRWSLCDPRLPFVGDRTSGSVHAYRDTGCSEVIVSIENCISISRIRIISSLTKMFSIWVISSSILNNLLNFG